MTHRLKWPRRRGVSILMALGSIALVGTMVVLAGSTARLQRQLLAQSLEQAQLAELVSIGRARARLQSSREASYAGESLEIELGQGPAAQIVIERRAAVDGASDAADAWRVVAIYDRQASEWIGAL